jgi:hypothetical protein
VLFEETAEVVVLAAVAGADQSDLRAAVVAEQRVAITGVLGLGDELVDVLHRIAGAAQLAGDVLHGAGLAHQADALGDELLARNIFEAGDALDRLGHQACGALGTVGRPVLVTAEVELLVAVLVGQRRQVRYPDTQLFEAGQRLAVVAQRLVVVEALVVGRAQLAAIDQAAGRLIDHHQFHAALLEAVA